MNERIVVSVDLITLFGSVKATYDGRKIDYAKYLEKISNTGQIYRAYAYGAYKDNEADKFINCLKSIGFEPKYVRAMMFDDKHDIRKTDRTIDMIIDIIRIIDKIDTVIIGTLNTNIVPFVYFLKEKGIKVILYSCNSKKEFKNVFDEYWIIDKQVLEEPIHSNDPSYI